MPIAAIEHIEVDEQGVARIVGTRMKVKHLAADKRAQGWSAEDMHENYKHHSLAAIHAALSYYYDHQAEPDAEIEQDLRLSEAEREAAGPSPLVARQRREGKL